MEKINEVRELMENDKQVKLIIDIAKNIVEQYREQLKNNIEEKKKMNLDEYSEENYVIRAEEALGYVDKILANFEDSVFDGKIIDGKFYHVAYNYGYRGNTVYQNSAWETLLENVQYGINRIFEQIGIPKYSIYPIIADIMERTRESNYVDGNLYKPLVDIKNIYFNSDGKYKAGELVINNRLACHLVNDKLTYNYTFSNDEPVICSQDNDLWFEIHKIKDLIDKYISEGLIEGKLESLLEQNRFINSTFNLVRRVGTFGGCYDNEKTRYYYEQLENPSPIYYKVARVIDSKKVDLNSMKICVLVQRDDEDIPFAKVLYNGKDAFNLDSTSKYDAEYFSRKTQFVDGMIFASTETGEILHLNPNHNCCIYGCESGKENVKRLINAMCTSGLDQDIKVPIYVTDGEVAPFIANEKELLGMPVTIESLEEKREFLDNLLAEHSISDSKTM